MIKKIAFYFLISLLFAFRAEAPAQRGNLIFESDFEDSGPLKKWFGQEKATTQAIMVVDTVACYGNYAARFEINKNDSLVSGGKRAELSLRNEKELKVKRWYGMSIYLPEAYIKNPEPEIVAQWHVYPDLELGENWRSPPISLITQNGHWKLAINWASEPVNTNETISGWQNVDLGLYNRDTWTDWVFQIHFSWEKDGLINVWKNDSLVYTRTGPNAYNDMTGPYLKIGLYKWEWRSAVPRRFLYYDEVRVGNENANRHDVRPGSSAKAAAPKYYKTHSPESKRNK